MAKQREQKTNAIRALDAAHIPYTFRTFPCEKALSGVEVATILGLEKERVFKTLVTQGKSGEHYVFMIPVAEELDLKKAAGAANEKAIHMIKSKELLPLTGYIHGGCSPIGMKKTFATYIDETAQLFESIIFSGGHLGYQLELTLDDLAKIVSFTYADLVV